MSTIHINMSRTTLPALKKKIPAPQAALLLGSGMGSILAKCPRVARFSYSQLPGMPSVNVQGHQGAMDVIEVGSMILLVFRGRFHYYEGKTFRQITAPVRLAAALGAELFVQTTASGGIRKDLTPGKLVQITDHLNFLQSDAYSSYAARLMADNGHSFLDMSGLYSPRLSRLFRAAAKSRKLALCCGTLAVMPGPCYETPAEISMLKTAGADAVCMSSLPEAVTAHALGLETATLSLISNRAAGLSKNILSHKDVLATAKRTSSRLEKLLLTFFQNLK